MIGAAVAVGSGVGDGAGVLVGAVVAVAAGRAVGCVGAGVAVVLLVQAVANRARPMVIRAMCCKRIIEYSPVENGTAALL